MSEKLVEFGKHKDKTISMLVEDYEGYCDWVMGLQANGKGSVHVNKLCKDIQEYKQMKKSGVGGTQTGSFDSKPAPKEYNTNSMSISRLLESYPVDSLPAMLYSVPKDALAVLIVDAQPKSQYMNTSVYDKTTGDFLGGCEWLG